jgi:hypothetical protein
MLIHVDQQPAAAMHASCCLPHRSYLY